MNAPPHAYRILGIVLIVAGFLIGAITLVPSFRHRIAITFFNSEATSPDDIHEKLKEAVAVYQKASPDTKLSAQIAMESAAKERTAYMRHLARTNPTEFLAEAFDEITRASLPSEIQNDIEHSQVIQGKLVAMHFDNPDPAKNYIEYGIETEDEGGGTPIPPPYC